MVMYTCNTSTGEAKARGSRDQDQAGLHSKYELAGATFQMLERETAKKTQVLTPVLRWPVPTESSLISLFD